MTRSLTTEFTCECVDPGCIHCRGECQATLDFVLYRVDTYDDDGTRFCNECGDDALDSGLFVAGLYASTRYGIGGYDD